MAIRPTNSKDKCPAKGLTCKTCGKMNHIAKVCRSKAVNHVKSNSDVRTVSTDVFLDSVKKDIHRNGQVYTELEVGPNLLSVDFNLDTGSQVNILLFHIFRKLCVKNTLAPTSSTLTAYNGKPIKTIGTCKLTCTFNDNERNL